MKDSIVKIRFNEELPTKYDYKHFEAVLEDGTVKTFHYSVNNPMPTENEMIGLTWDELIELCKKKWYEALEDNLQPNNNAN